MRARPSARRPAFTPALCLFAIALGAVTTLAHAQAAEAPALKRVLLSTGGVGYFEFEAEVSGNSELSLPVRVDQIDDILKSIVIFDDKGGAGTVRLPSRLPPRELFSDLPFDHGALDSLSALLSQLIGTEIVAIGPRQISGRVVSVAREDVPLESGDSVTRHRVAVLGTRGLEHFILEDSRSIQFKDKALQAGFERALASLAARGSDLGRTLTIESRGEGTRRVTIGYVVETPLWKTAYRLVLPPIEAEDSETALLQGWAILENASGQDWKAVELTLAAGNPVTFRQALYDAYYVDRPEVPVEVLGRVLPSPDTGGVGFGFDAMAAAPAPMMERADMMGAAEATEPVVVTARKRDSMIDDMATGGEAMTQVTFRFDQPVSVARGQSLVVPITNRKVPAQRVAHYQPDQDPLHPLAAVDLENDGAVSLPPGAMTLYEEVATGGHSYIGDARIGVLPAGDKRLLAYAVDEKTTITTDHEYADRIDVGTIANGVLKIRRVDRSETVFTLKAPANEAREVIVEVYRGNATLVEPQLDGIEQTASTYRVPAKLAPGEQATLIVVLEEPIEETLELLNLNARRIGVFLQSQTIPPRLKAVFEELTALHGAVETETRTIAAIDKEREAIYTEQERLRKNIEAVPERSALKTRYLEILNQQEDDLAQLKKRDEAAKDARDKARQALADYIAGLSL